MSSILDINNDMLQVQAEIVAAGGEIEPGSELEARWDAACAAMSTKLEGCRGFLEISDAIETRVREEAKRLKDKADAMKKTRARFLTYLDHVLGERDSLQGEIVTLKRAKNPPSLVVTSAQHLWEYAERARLTKIEKLEVVPFEKTYFATEDGMYQVTLDKAAIKARLKTESVPGAELVQGHRIVLK